VLANIPLQAWTGPEGSSRLIEASRISVQSAHEGCKVVSLTHRPPLPQELFQVVISVRGGVHPRGIVRPDNIENRTRDFPACNAVPHPTRHRLPYWQIHVSYVFFILKNVYLFYISVIL
jgi:hypothetical protein